MKFVCFLLFIFNSLVATAQYPQVDLPGSQKRTFYSKVVEQEYELNIQTTGVDKDTSQKYPVIYLLDSQWDFPLVRSIIGQQYYDGFIPGVILVGITWGGKNANHDSLRARDYTPSYENTIPQSGGGRKFLTFIKDELIPYIEGEFDADNKNRILMGCSFGGLFTMYSMFEEPDLFHSYIAASPAYNWNKQSLYSHEEDYFNKKPIHKAKLFMTMGGVENGVPGYNKLVQHLTSRKYENLEIKSGVLENTGHSGTKSETYSRGLQFAFQRSVLKLSPEKLKVFVGTYQSGKGKPVTIQINGDQIELVNSSGNKYLLYAKSENEFYSTAEFLNVKFQEKKGVQKLTLQTYSSSELMNKTN